MSYCRGLVKSFIHLKQLSRNTAIEDDVQKLIKVQCHKVSGWVRFWGCMCPLGGTRCFLRAFNVLMLVMLSKFQRNEEWQQDLLCEQFGLCGIIFWTPWGHRSHRQTQDNGVSHRVSWSLKRLKAYLYQIQSSSQMGEYTVHQACENQMAEKQL